MKCIEIINNLYKNNPYAKNILIKHSELVAIKALEIAQKFKGRCDLKFIYESAMLHDIGIIGTNSKILGCTGNSPYICHGIIGMEILEKEGLYKHALVCERHIGFGISKQEIIKNDLPLPKRDMLPITLEEKIICFADNFFSKKPNNLEKEETMEDIKQEALKHSREQIIRCEELIKTLNY